LINLTESVTDSDANPVTVSVVASPLHGTAVLHANGSATYTPEDNYNGTDNFSYMANDGKADSNIANVTITILPVNDMPIAINATLTTLEDTPIQMVLVNSTVDVDGDVVEIIIVEPPINGLLEIGNDNSTVTYIPLQDYNGQDSFEYMLSDMIHNSTIGTITIDVLAVNDPPVLEGELNYVVDEDELLIMHILVLFTDVDADTLTISAITETQNGTSTLYENGTVTYTPEPDYNGQDSFDVTVSDGNEGGSVTETVTITINPVNDAPVSNDINATTEEDVPVDIMLSATDKEEDDLTFAIILPPSHGTLGDVGENGTVTYTPNPNYSGSDSFTFRASDGISLSNIATVSITITAVNDNPVANNNTYNIDQDVVATLDVLENDVDTDGDTLTIVNVTQPEHGSVSINEAADRVIYTPETGNNLTDIFEYTITDGNDGYAIATVTVFIDTENDAPTALDANEVTDEETPIEITLLATDPDAASILTFTIISPPANGILSGFSASTGTVTYTPNLNVNGVDSFTFQVNDGIEESNIASVTITILPVNDDPVAVEDPFEVAEDGTLNDNVLANDFDVDGDSLGAEAFGPQATEHGMVTMGTDGSFAYTPEADYNGPDSFQYIVTDGNGGTAIGTVSITVQPENDLPVANDDFAFTTLEAPVLVRVLLNDSDIDGDSLTVIQPVGGASTGTVAIADGGQAVIYTPGTDFAGTDQFTYTVSDGEGGIATATVTVEVYPARFGHLQPPVGGSGTHEFEQGNTANVRFKLFDEAGQEIKDAAVILMIQQVDSSNNPIGPVMEATSAGGSNDGNLFRYSNSFYQYNLKTDTMEIGKWALYVYLLDGDDQILMEDAPIDGISATILIK
jgi:VCBS repeat-containing protein